MRRQQPAHRRRVCPVFRLCHCGHQATKRIKHTHRRIPPCSCHRPRQHHMSIQQRPYGIHHRILQVVSFHQHGVESRDAPISKIPRTLHELRQAHKHRRCVPFARRRLSCCQSNLACSHRVSRQRIEHQQDMLPSRCIKLRYGCSSHRGAHSL